MPSVFNQSIKKLSLLFVLMALLSLFFVGGSVSSCRPIVTGGTVAIGGSDSVGGLLSTGGDTSSPVGGAQNLGGSSAADTQEATGGDSAMAFIEPTCPLGVRLDKVSKDADRKLGWKPNPDRQRGHKVRMLATGGYIPPSMGWLSNIDFSTDQDGVGACSFFGLIDALTFRPFKLTGTATSLNQLGLSGYSAATKLDCGCAWNATSCPGSYPPVDQGSTGVSALQAALLMQQAGKMPKSFSTYSTPETFEEMLHEVATKGPCMVGTRWPSSMMHTVGCGHLEVDSNLNTNDGHERAIVELQVVVKNGVLDMNQSLVWEVNSWGQDWAACVRKRCGFHSITFADEKRLIEAGGEVDCPDPP